MLSFIGNLTNVVKVPAIHGAVKPYEDPEGHAHGMTQNFWETHLKGIEPQMRQTESTFWFHIFVVMPLLTSCSIFFTYESESTTKNLTA